MVVKHVLIFSSSKDHEIEEALCEARKLHNAKKKVRLQPGFEGLFGGG